MIKRIMNAAVFLWQHSPRWRYLVIFTGLVFMGAIGQLTSNSSPQVQQPQFQTNSNQTFQANNLTSINPVAPLDQQSVARLEFFYKKASEEESNTAAEGELCEKLTQLLIQSGITDVDKVWASNAQQDMLKKVNICELELVDSDKRWQMVKDLGANIDSFGIQEAQAFLKAEKMLTDFDKSRSVLVRQTWQDRANSLQSVLDEYLKELKHVTLLSALYRPDDPKAVQASNDLVNSREKLLNLPLFPKFNELAKEEINAINIMNEAYEAKQKSEFKLATLSESLNPNAQDVTGIILALSNLSPIDKVRWNISNPDTRIDELEKQQLQNIGQAVTTTLPIYKQRPTRQLAEQLKTLYELAVNNKIDLTPDQEIGLKQVIAELNASNLRIQNVVKLAKAWQQAKQTGRDIKLEEMIIAALKSTLIPGKAEAQPFDWDGMNSIDKLAFGILVSASVEIQGNLTQQSVNLIAVNLDLTGLSDNIIVPIVPIIQQAFDTAGFRLTTSRKDAAIDVIVFDPRISDQGSDPETGQKRYELKLKMRLIWNYSGRVSELPVVAAIGRGSENAEAIASARNKAAEVIVKNTVISLQNFQ